VRIFARFLGLLVLVVSISACAATIKNPIWHFEKEAVRVHVKADNKLNLYNGKEHTLYMCIYQLQELNGLDQLTQDPEGIRQLLECRLFDETVALASSKIIYAGESITIKLDRSEKANYLALVTGYSAELTNDRMVRRHKFQTYKKKESYFKNTYQCVPCVLDVALSLGPNQIEYSKILPKEVMCSDECK
jgi:UDP-galactopyranose mutase